jgi:hypothetical protein
VGSLEAMGKKGKKRKAKEVEEKVRGLMVTQYGEVSSFYFLLFVLCFLLGRT